MLALVMFAMACSLVATTLVASQQLPTTCKPYEILLDYCVPYLVFTTGFNFKPTTPCCEGATYAFNKAMSDNTCASIVTICYCLWFAKAYLKYDPSKLVNPPSECKIKLSFPINTCIFG